MVKSKISDALQKKIARRAKRAFEHFDEGRSKTSHRITEVTATTLRYRLPYTDEKGFSDDANYYGSKRVLIERDGDKIFINRPSPKLLELLDLRYRSQVDDELKAHEGRVRAYKLTDKEGTGPIYPGVYYEIGKKIEDSKSVNTDDSKDCAEGIHLASLEWCKEQRKSNDYPKGERIFAVEFERDDLAVIPKKHSKNPGKFRVYRLTVVGEMDPVKDFAEPLAPLIDLSPPPAVAVPLLTDSKHEVVEPPVKPDEIIVKPVDEPVKAEEPESGGVFGAIKRVFKRKKK